MQFYQVSLGGDKVEICACDNATNVPISESYFATAQGQICRRTSENSKEFFYL